MAVRSKRKPASRAGPVARIARSLHIGLNSVDPVHYQGWTGDLAACEYDAKDMDLIARDSGFRSEILLTRSATREAVVDRIAKAAAELRQGDIYFLTYSGHGGQVPDLGSDEADRLDETWCLFDGELLDDELFGFWTQFAPGVRVLVVSDSCHSGTVTRMALSATLADGSAVLAGSGRSYRAMPPGVAGRVFRANRDFYTRIARAAKIDDKVRDNPSAALKATIRLISGCQDNQLSMDGLANGRFTEELLKVWNNGAFSGNYLQFHRKILSGMPPDQSPNHYVIGAQNDAFDAERPFAA